MKIFSFFLLLLSFSVHAATDPVKVLKEKVMSRADFEAGVDTFYQNFRVATGMMSETTKLAEQVAIRTATLTSNFYDVIYRVKPLLAQDKKDFQSWYIYLNALLEGLNQGYSFDGKELDYVAYLAMKAAEELEDKYLVLWKRSELTLAGDDVASLKAFLKENADIKLLQKKHNELTTLYPKKFAPFKTDRPQNQNLASVCLVLTQNLSHNRLFNYKPFVTVTPALPDFAVQGRTSNLCVEGFDYGKEYTIKLKKGLTSEQNMTMEQDYEFPVYIQHRKPGLTFREQGYVLPAKGPQLLPLNTVNLAKAHMQLYRIPARNYASFQEYDNFLGNLTYSYNVNRITRNQAEKIWHGSMTTEAAMNKTTTHGIPLSAFLNKELDPGLYLLTAEDGDKDDPHKRLLTTQWFVVSDIGLTAYKGADGIHVFSHALSTAEPLRTEMTLIAFNNKVLGTVEADSQGHAHFAPALVRGTEGNRPRYIYVRRGESDFTFLELKAEGFDFKDRGIDGRDPAQKHDAYLYTERGVYRPGEEVNITGLMRSKNFEVQKGQKLTLKVFSPNRKEIISELVDDQGAGSYAYTYELPASAPQGEWEVKLFLDPKAVALATCKFEINDYVPPKVDLKLTSETKLLMPGNDAGIKINATYYYGKKASNLVVQGRADLKKADKPFKGYEKASFGFEEEQFLPLQFTFAETKTDQQGLATLRKNISTKTDISSPLTLEVEAGIIENGGRYIQKKIAIPYFQHPFYIGIIPEFKDRQAGDKKASFKIVALDTDGVIRPLTNLKYSLLEEEQSFSWYRQSSNVNYEAMIRTRVLTQGDLTLDEVKPQSLSFDIASYGRYRLEIVDPKTGLGASYRFSSGWSFGASPDKPDILDIHVDKKAYKKDDDIKLRINAPFEGRVMMLAVGPDSIIPLQQTSLDEGGEEFEVEIPRDLRDSPGFYLSATAFRPMDTDKQQMISRAIGMVWISLIHEELGSPLQLTHDKEIKSQSSFDVTLTYDKSMKKSYATVALVDESVLDLTGFKSPDPLAYFFSQQKLGYKVYDVYGKLINPFGTTLNDSVVGGGLLYGRALPLLPANAFKTISLFSGIVKLEGEGQQKISFDIPDFTGKARIMAVIWDDTKMAAQSSTLIVKDDVIVDLALPRFLGTEDEANTHLSLSNTTKTKQDYRLNLNVSGPIQVEGFPERVSLAPEHEQTFPLKIWGQGKEGVASFAITMRDEKGESRETNFDLAVRSPLIDYQKRVYITLQPGKEKNLDDSILNGFDSSTAQAILSLGGMPNFGVEALQKTLMDYPYTCVEQITSKGYAYLLQSQDEIDVKELSELVANVMGYQTFSGEFSLWPGGVNPEFWSTAYATEFLLKTQAQAKALPALYVPKGGVELSLRHMRSIVQMTTSEHNLIAQSYAHYLLALGGKISVSQVRFFADNNKLLLKNSKLGRAFIGAAFALLGDIKQAFEHFNQALVLMSTKDDPFGTPLRDKILVLVLLAETTEGFPNFMSRVDEIASQISATDHLSTQERGWLLRLGYMLAQRNSSYEIELNDEPKKGENSFDYDVTSDVQSKGVNLHNKGENPLYAMVTVSGKMQNKSPQQKEAPFTIEREIYTNSGALHEGPLKHGESYVFVITGEIKKHEARHVILTDKLPAGVEIEITAPVLPWLKDTTFALYQEKRDDRFVASYKPTKDKLKFKFSYLVRAIAPGEFEHPAPVVENMYRPAESAYGKAGTMNVQK